MNKKSKLSEEQKQTKIDEKRTRVHAFAPARITKYMNASNQVAMLFRYPLTDEEKAKILKVVRQETANIEEAYRGEHKKKTLFTF